MKSDTKTVIDEHVKNMGIPESTGRDILDAKEVVEAYLKNQKEIARIGTEAGASEEAIKIEMHDLDTEYIRRQEELNDEKRRRYSVLNNKLITVQADCKDALKPLWEQVNQVERIITLLRIAETIQPVRDIADSEVTTYHGEYLEWLECLFKGDYLIIRLLITENKKPKNKYSLLAYGRCAFRDESLLRKFYHYGTPNLRDHDGGFNVLLELGSFPSIPDAKAYAQKNANKPLRKFIDDYVKLKAEYLEVTATYKLSDFEQITRVKGGSK